MKQLSRKDAPGSQWFWCAITVLFLIQTVRGYVKPNSAMSRTECRRKALKSAAGEGLVFLAPACTLAKDKGKLCLGIGGRI